MADDAALRISTTVDLSGTQQLTASTEEMSSAMAEATVQSQRLQLVTKETAASHGALRTQIGLVDNAIRGAHAQAMADLVRRFSKSAVVMNLLPLAATGAGFVVMGGLVLEAAGKVNEWIHSAELAREAWQNAMQPLENSAEKLQQAVLKDKIALAELTGGPVADLQKALQGVNDKVAGIDFAAKVQHQVTEAEKQIQSFWDFLDFSQQNAGAESKQFFRDYFNTIQNQGLSAGPKLLSNEIAKITAEIQQNQTQVDKLRSNLSSGQLQSRFNPTGDTGTAGLAMIGALKGRNDQLNKYLELLHEINTNENSTQEENSLKEQISQVKQVQHATKEAAEEAKRLARAHEEAVRAIDEANRKILEQQREVDKLRQQEQEKVEESGTSLLNAQASLAAAQTKAIYDRREQAVKQALEIGIISEREYATRIKAIYEQEEANRLQVLNDEKKFYQAEADAAGAKGDTVAKNNALAKVAQLDQQILQLNQQFGQRIAEQNAVIWRQMSQPMNVFFAGFDSSIQRATQQWMSGTRTFSNAFASSMGEMVIKDVEGIEKILAKDAEMWIRRAVLHQQANAVNAALDVSAATTKNATEAATSGKSVMRSASSAAAKSYDAMAGIPIVGPELGAAAAAATFAAVMAFEGLASAAGGFDVPALPSGGMLANIHSREMVLPEKHADVIRSMADQGGGARPVNATFHFSPVINGNFDVEKHGEQLFQFMRGKLSRMGVRS